MSEHDLQKSGRGERGSPSGAGERVGEARGSRKAPPSSAPRRPEPPRERMKHTSFRIDTSLMDRIEALKPMFSRRYQATPNSQMIRILLDHALTSLERRRKREQR